MHSSYLEKFRKVIDHMHNNLGEDITLDDLAKVAAISPFHFHRIFAAYFGETIGEMLLRMRMEKAIQLLLMRKANSILEAALCVGFNNPSSFARAFKRYFGFPPSEVLKKDSTANSKFGTLKSKYRKDIRVCDLYPVPILNETGEKIMQVQIVKKDAIHVIGLETNLSHESSMGAWLKLYEWYLENKGDSVHEWKGIGIYRDDPSVTPREKCKAKNCLVVDRALQISAPYFSDIIPKGRYAIATYRVPQEDLGKWGDRNFKPDAFHNFIQSFLKDWLISSGHEADHYPFMMHYHLRQELPLDHQGHKHFDVSMIDLVVKLKD